jgi:two-component system CheB/CheR fusion protein
MTRRRSHGPPPAQEPVASEGPNVPSFPVVGIGTSAGGLDALKTLFRATSADPGVAFVVVVHLSPEHESRLPEVLQPELPLPIEQVQGDTRLTPNRIYVIPPRSNLEAIDTHLRLTALEAERQARAPIDHFFRTLADTHGDQAIGVVLTGTGADGTLGLRRIKEEGGLTIVQDPREAAFDGMPRSALAAAPVDLVLPLGDIPAAIARYVSSGHQVPRSVAAADPEDGSAQDLLRRTFSRIRTRTGRDFSHYKPSTLLRRIVRRMQLRGTPEPADYLALLRADPEEAIALSDDFLITVTSFFRDPEAFDALARTAIPEIVAERPPGKPIRAWVVGCATGEEAYSVAMLLLEATAALPSTPNIQVFASDLHGPSLARAREGVYPADIEADVSGERLDRFFNREADGYRVRSEVRETVTFAPHNVLSDPPFSRLDLLTCRNLLIYFQRELQKQVLDIFHYALRPSGFLMLGRSEAVSGSDLFRPEEKAHAIFRKRNVPTPEPRLPVFALIQQAAAHHEASEPTGREQRDKELPYSQLHRTMVDTYGPPSVLVTPDDNVAHFSARAGRFFVQPGGTPTTNLFRLVREELRLELRAGLSLARRERRAVRTQRVFVRFDGEAYDVIADVRPAIDHDDQDHALILFEQHAPRGEQGLDPRFSTGSVESDSDQEETAPDPRSTAREQELREEKQRLEQHLRATIDEYETSQEEIRASNEELQSANEELRSTMEELETSKEELQSVNEELQTVNQENRQKVEELDQLSSDLQNMFAAADIATIFLDRSLRIVRFTPQTANLFNIRNSDRGRPLDDFNHRLLTKGLTTDVRRVRDELVPIEREVQDENHQWYLARILPYRTEDDRIAGVVLTLVEITSRKKAEDQLRAAKEFSEHITETLPDPLLVLRSDLTVTAANAAFFETFQTLRDETLGVKIYDLGNGQWDIPALRRLLEDVLPQNHVFTGFEVDHRFESLGRRIMLVNARRMAHQDLILLGIQDITDRFHQRQALSKSETRYRAVAELSPEAILVYQGDRCVFANDAAARLLDADSTDDLIGHSPFRFVESDYHGAIDSLIARIRAGDRADDRLVQRWRRLDGTGVDVEVTAGPIEWEDDEPAALLLARDVTAWRKAEAELREASLQKDEFLAMLGHELRNPLAAIQAANQLIGDDVEEQDDLRHAHDVLARQTGHMTRLIDGLLEVSRIERGKIDIRLEHVDLGEVLHGVLDDHQSAIAARGLALVRELPDAPFPLLGDEVRLAQVFGNLLGNAVKFTEPPGAITVTLTREGGTATVRLRDTGVGMRPEVLEQVFEAFRQEAPEDRNRGQGGLGLGLALVRGLVGLHGGEVSAHSEGRGTGTTMTVRLPLATQLGPQPEDPSDRGADETTRMGAAGRAPEPDVLPASGAPARAPGKTRDAPELSRATARRRLLLVEDSTDGAVVFQSLLERRGYRVALAATVVEALEVLRREPIDFVLCDLGLPGMSGHELARIVRRDQQLAPIPLVALTGFGRPQDRKQALAAGFDEHLVKPAELDEIEALIARLAGDPAGEPAPPD